MERATAARRIYEGSTLGLSPIPTQPQERNERPAALQVRDEVFRILARIRTQLSSDDRVLLFTGVTESEGSSELAHESALALSKIEGGILLLDAAISSPSLHQRFGGPASPGLAEVITRRFSLSESVRADVDDRLHLMPAGSSKLGAAELFASPELQMIMQVLRTQYRYIIVSGPPVLTEASSSLVSCAADGVVLTLSSGSQRRAQALAAYNELVAVKARMLGVVLFTPEQADSNRKPESGPPPDAPSGSVTQLAKPHQIIPQKTQMRSGQEVLFAALLQSGFRF